MVHLFITSEVFGLENALQPRAQISTLLYLFLRQTGLSVVAAASVCWSCVFSSPSNPTPSTFTPGKKVEPQN